ncbi:MAG TPA: hypothetical protein VKE98_07090, partial [Gemmataceae bacterium]|nr:hypothetical protein [Gemmataceae bacterium]
RGMRPEDVMARHLPAVPAVESLKAELNILSGAPPIVPLPSGPPVIVPPAPPVLVPPPPPPVVVPPTSYWR